MVLKGRERKEVASGHVSEGERGARTLTQVPLSFTAAEDVRFPSRTRSVDPAATSLVRGLSDFSKSLVESMNILIAFVLRI